MNKKIYLKTNTDINAISEVLSWLEQINQPPFNNQQTWWELQTLLVEGFINIVEHAHKNLPIETPIQLEVIRFKEDIEIRMWSCGKPFDLVKQLQITSELEDNDEERGRGLKIMSTIADKMTYEPTEDNRYCLFISKHY
ncbi:anti-sigma regulatory factor [Anabaena cylindrica UHCC 0172]|uniref:ATP-binding protein n=1 Tax=Anabaena cylindrica TaxID=1165 RepID=UPI002B1F312F|nr:anti-sigma regulatory factor [Anabaena cylindrica]MEA5552652.1 anti-sigma regulatory factor [Anabaena cylindrica UHCC 0172]